MICPRCNSINVHKDGKYNAKDALVQKYKCKACTRYFSVPVNTDIIDEEKKVVPGQVHMFESDEIIRLHGLTDMHVGSTDFDRKKFSEAVKVIYEDDNARWFGNGDMIECIPPHYKISQRGQYASPDDQHMEFLGLIFPIIDKCLFVRGGNHDYLRSMMMLDYDVSRMIAKDMNVPYFPFPGYSCIKIGDSEWIMASGHGKSGAKNGDLEIDRLASVYSKADVFFLGHNHQLYAKPIDSLKIDWEKSEETLYRRWYVRGGSFLRYARYARYALYPIVRTGWVTMEFTKDGIKCWTN